MNYQDFLEFVEEQTLVIAAELAATQSAILTEIADASIDLSKINSTGLAYSYSYGAVVGGGTFTITVLADKNDPSKYKGYVTGELGAGISFSTPVGAVETGVVAYQNTYDEFAGWFVGGQFTAGVAVQSVVSLPGGDVAFIVGGATSVSLQVLASYTWGVEELIAELPDNAFNECFPAETLITLYDGLRKPISDIRIGDAILSHDENGDLVKGIVDKLFRNVTQEFVKLEFADGRDDLVATPGHRFLTEMGDYMEIGHMLRLSGGSVRVVDQDGSVVTARGELLTYSIETAELYEQSAAKATVFQGNLAVKEEAPEGWATYNFEVRRYHTYIADDIRVHNDSILSYLEGGDSLYALTDDFKDMAIARDVDGDGVKEIVLLDGERFDGTGSSTFLEVTQTFTPNNPNADVEALLAQFIINNPAAASNVFDPGNGNIPGDGIASDDIVEILTDDIGGTLSARQFGGVGVPSLADLVTAAVTGSAQDLIRALFAPLIGTPGTIEYASGEGDQTLEPKGPDSLSILLFIMGLDANAEIIPAVTTDFGFVIFPAVTLGSMLSEMELPQLGQFEVSFGAGISQDDVTRAQVGNNLVLTIENSDGSSNTLTLEKVYSDGNASEIVEINFADGTGAELSALEETRTNEAPVVSIPLVDQSSAEEAAVNFTLPTGAFSDADGDTLTLTALQSDDTALPNWLSFDGSSFTGTPPSNYTGTLQLKVTASDGEEIVSSSFALEITNVNDAPIVAQEIDDISIPENASWNFVVPVGTFTDIDGDGLNLTATQVNDDALPNWLSFDASTGTFSGTPPLGSIGTLDIKVTATDGTLSVSDDFVLSVTNVNDAPIVATELIDQSFDEETAVNFTLPIDAFSDVDGDTLTLTALQSDNTALPIWLSFDGSSFTGTPPSNYTGTLQLKVTASDGQLSVSDNFTLEITGVNDAPIVAQEIDDVSIAEGAALSYAVPVGTFSDIDGDVLSLSAALVGGDALPSWLSFDASTVSFSGTPPLGSIGTLDIKVTATDGTLSVSDEFVLNVTNVNDAPIIATELIDQSSVEDSAVNFTLPADAFSDADGDSLTLSALQANDLALPSWLSFDGSNFTGTPPADFVGNIAIKVTANDGQATVSDIFTLEITGVNDAPIVAQQIADLSVTEGAVLNYVLPAGTFSDIDGDTLSLSASLANEDALPSWLSFDANTGTFSGTPPVGDIGSLDIKVSATDGTLSVSDDFVLAVTVDTVPSDNVINDDNTTTQYLSGTSGNDVFAINAASTDYGWSPTQDGTGTVIWLLGGDPGDHDILFHNVEQFEKVQFTDRTVDLINEPSNQNQVINTQTDDSSVIQYLNGTSGDDVFVINATSTDYGWGPTQDGTGTVVWLLAGSPSDHDILFHNVEQFEKVQFNDRTVNLVNEPISSSIDIQFDDNTVTQYLNGTSADDIFMIDASSADYNWAPTQDGTGTVIWLLGGEPGDHDILFHNVAQFEKIGFNDRTVNLVNEPSSLAADVQSDDSSVIQYLNGTSGDDTFAINAASTDYGWGPTQDGTGTVVWLLAGSPGDHDILFHNVAQFEKVQFNDRTVNLINEPSSIILGTSGNDAGTSASIQGSWGDDIIQVSAGNDEIDGGNGTDLFNIIGSGSALSNFTFSTDADGALVVSSTAFGTNTLSNVEKVSFEEDNLVKTVQELLDGIDTGTGPTEPNTITGTSGDDFLDGTEGNDLMLGLAGDDQFYSSDGNDKYEGGSGYNQVNYGGSATDYTFVENADGSVIATHIPTSKVDTLIDIGGIWFNGEGAWYDLDSISVPASPGSNIAPIVANALADQSSPEDTDVNFTLPVGAFSDVDGDVLTLTALLSDGSALPVWLTFDGSSFTGTPPVGFNGSLAIEVTASDGSLSASDTFSLDVTASSSTILGTNGNDNDSTGQVKGTAGDDVIDALAGDDVIWASAGNDTIDGGAGNDYFDIIGSGSAYSNFTFSAGANGTLVVTSLAFGTNTLTNVENVWFQEDGFTKTVQELLDGINSGGGSGADTILGTSGNDNDSTGQVKGTAGDDVIDALAGDDVIWASAGNDTIDGGAGNDYFDIIGSGSAYSNFTFSAGANGSLVVTSLAFGTNTLSNVENVWFQEDGFTKTVQELLAGIGSGTSPSGPNTITGTSGNDFLDGTSDNDLMLGLEGNDQFYSSDGNDRYEGSTGYNQVNYDGSSTDYTFIENTDSSVTVTHNTSAKTDQLIDIDGIWFNGESAWYGVGSLTSTETTTANTITGSSTDDVLIATADDDTFVFASNMGNDVIGGFTAGANSNDVVELQSMSDFDTYAEVLAAAVDDGVDTTIAIDANNSITLNNVVVADLHQDDFSFA